jgi:hypothetical protein
MLAMLRLFLFPALLMAGATLASAGCRACSTCHDYDPPVADCDCGTCGGHRAGSAAGGYVTTGGDVVAPAPTAAPVTTVPPVTTEDQQYAQ